MKDNEEKQKGRAEIKGAAKFTASSLISAGVDLSIYQIILSTLPLPQGQLIFVATVISRLASGTVNYIINRRFSFQSENKPLGEIIRFGALFIVKMCLSAWLVTLLSFIPLPSVAIKALVDTLLFFANYVCQRFWVFKKR